LAVGLPQHLNEHRSKGPVLLAVDQEFPSLIGLLEVGANLADIQSREDSTRIEAAVTRGRIALLCAVAGLTVAGANLTIYAVERDCLPDPYGYSDPCTAQEWISFGITVACWLVATYLVARREAIGPFACAFMGSMLWLGLVAFLLLLPRSGPWLENSVLSEAWLYLRVGAIMAPVIGLLTAGIGYAMQVSIQARRRRRLPHAA
jgi:hypothetical protein